MTSKVLRALPLPPPQTPGRDRSPELGDPSKFTQYNTQTGRPIRKSAGRVQRVAGYVDSGTLGEGEEEEDFASLTTDESDNSIEDVDNDDMERHNRTNKKKRKRQRSPSPPSPRLEPIIYSQELDQLTDNESGGAFHRSAPKKPPITLQFNIPLGFHGPLFATLDSAMLRTSDKGILHEMRPAMTKKARIASPNPLLVMAQGRRKGFTDLPPELRNTVYRHLFVRKGQDLRIPPPKDGSGLSQSAQFLRTCRLVHNEGCSVLYGENTFQFNRHFSTRSQFWEPVAREIGYQDVLHFLRMMGPENLQYLRDIKFTFDDALPRDTPYLDSHEKRRYLNDEYLMNCLRILRVAKLRKVLVRFYGRRTIHKSDIRFLGYLVQVKADEVDRFADHWSHPHNKLPDYVWHDIKGAMTRKKKLYEKE